MKLKKKLPVLIAIVVGLLLGWFVSATVLAGEKISVARKGEAHLHIVVSPDAGKRVTKSAQHLADYLRQITGGTFEVRTGDGTEGIAVGNYQDFPKLGLAQRFDPEDLIRRDEYLIRTHQKGIYLVGATDLAAQHGVWDFLYRLGYRRFFPTETWEVIPEDSDLQVKMDVFEAPDFYNRNAPRGAPWSDGQMWSLWKDRNRVTSAAKLSTGHAYDSIIRRNQKAFDEHPEYLALRDRKRGGNKFCIANEGLRQLVVEDAVRRIKNNPKRDSISMDPSDGGGWCQCKECQKMGSVSDRAVLLANAVAEAINELGYGEKHVGIYAYNMHSPPPSVDVHPRVIVSIATAFIKGGYTFEELIDGWAQRANMIGIRDYHDVYLWSNAMPCRARGGRIKYLTERIPYYYEKGARFINSEASDSWGANGLGYYLTTRLVWDVDAAKKVDELVDDFLTNAFGQARQPMRAFYRLITKKSEKVRTHEDLVARMYELLAEARRLAQDPEVHARLDELIVYTRYVELYFRYADADGRKASKRAAQDLYRHAYRMQDTMLIHIRGLFRALRRRGIGVPDEADAGRLSVDRPLKRSASDRKADSTEKESEEIADLLGDVTAGDGKEKKEGPSADLQKQMKELQVVDIDDWTSDKLFTDEEIIGILEAGLKNNEKDKIDFEPVSYSTDLVPVDELDLKDVKTEHYPNYRGRHTLYTWFSKGNRQIILQVTGGKIYSGVLGDIEMQLVWIDGQKEKTIQEVVVSPEGEGKTREVVFKTPHSGLHKIEWTDHSDMTHIEWTPGQPMTFRSSLSDAEHPYHRWNRYFYVPKGTKVVGGFATSTNGVLLDGSGKKVFDFGQLDSADYFSVPVPEGEDGRLWKFYRGTGDRRLMTVPPYLARDEEELLLPREVVEADK